MIMKLKKYMKVVYEQSELSTTGLPDDTVMGYEEGSKEYRTDTIWYHIQKLRSLVSKNKRFPLLFKVTILVISAPHSYAGIERIFSLASKIKAKELTSILSVKIGRPESVSNRY